MNRTLSLPVQELIRASARVLGFATNHKGLVEEDLEAVLSCAHELMHDIKSSHPASQPASQKVQVCLLFCLVCRLVRDEQETADAPWITQQTYEQSTGIDPTDCLLIHTYCPVCYQYLPRAA
jgi:hypothetical protein